MPEDKFRFEELKRSIENFKSIVPKLIANDIRNYSLKSFVNQSFEGKPWKEVQRRIEGTNAYKYPKKKDLGRRTRPILIGKGSTKLRRAVANSIEVTEWPTVRLVVPLVYAPVHNYGLDGMPARPFMRDTKKLREVITKRFKTELKKVFR